MTVYSGWLAYVISLTFVVCPPPPLMTVPVPENAPDHCPASRTKKNTMITSMTISLLPGRRL